MKGTFLRCHILAWMAAVVLAYVGAAVLNAIPPKLLFHHPLIGPVLPVFVIVTLIEVLVAWRVALLLGRFDLLLLIAGTFTPALAFGVGYSMDVHTFLPDDGHTFFDVLTWGARPFDCWGQFEIFALILGWAIVTIGAGIAIKRWTQTRSTLTAQSPADARKMNLWLAFDIGLIVCATVATLRAEVVNRMAEGKPGYLTRRLLSPASSDNERLHAIWELSMVETDESTQALRRAAREQQPPANLMAAATLLERNDISELPLLEDYIVQHSSQSPPTAGPFNLGSYLGYIKDPAAAPILIRLMTSPNAETRRGAAHALYNIKSPEAIPLMIKGLADSDQEVRCWSVRVLAVLAGPDKNGKSWEPFLEAFQRDEPLYLDHWKAWAKQRSQTSPLAHP